MLEGEQLGHWLAARCGKLTASRMGDAMAFLKDGKTPSAKRSQLMRELLAERLTGESARHFVTDAMTWGLEKECDAKAAYEALTGTFVDDAGFYDHQGIDNFGATPDGLLPGGGLIETKCPTSATFVEWVIAGVVPDEHKPQMAAQCACTGRAWVEFVAYDPRVRNPRKQLFVRRFEPTAEEVEAVEAAAAKFLAELDQMFALFTERAA